MNTIDKYLRDYAEPETKHLENLFASNKECYQYCVVIPIYDENTDFLIRLQQHLRIKDVLLIVVINQPDTSSANSKNKYLYEYVLNGKIVASAGNLSHVCLDKLDILLVDRFSKNNTIPSKQGVGLARKIGGDIAVKLYKVKRLIKPWFYSTDADAHLPNNYFSDAFGSFYQKKPVSACVFDFAHKRNSSLVSQATYMYEIAIKYYRNALKWAGSPYAFFTLGSTLSVAIDAYCKVRGFPKRAAGEDFYLLNKLAKIGEVSFQENIHIQLDARISQRVPFGTGPAVQEILNQKSQQQEYCYYSPQIFIYLKHWIDYVNHSCDCYFDDIETLRQSKTAPKVTLTSFFKASFNRLPDEVIAATDALGFNKFIEHANKQCHDKKNFLAHFHDWFDSFRTLKFVHYMQDHFISAKPLQECLQESTPYWTNYPIFKEFIEKHESPAK